LKKLYVNNRLISNLKMIKGESVVFQPCGAECKKKSKPQ